MPPAGRSRTSRARCSAAPATAASRRRPSSTPSCSRAASARRPTSCRRRCTPSTPPAAGRSRCGAPTDTVYKNIPASGDAGGRALTLRPEGTAPVMRAYAEHGMQKLPQPVKLWYCGSYFRPEQPQAGRFRQFWQIGAEAIGSDDPAVDAEAILLLQTIIYELGVRGVRLRLGSLGTPETRADYRELLVAHLRANEDRLSEGVRSRID